MSEQKWLIEINNALKDIEEDAQTNDARIRHAQAKSDGVLTLFFIFITFFALVNVYFVFEWTQEATAMIHEVEEIHVNLEKISDNMVVINDSMQTMRNQTLLVPVLDEEMNSFVSSMQGMSLETQVMQHNMQNINGSMVEINQSMQTMQQQFNQLNQSVHQMSRDVNDMSQVVPSR